MVYFGTITRYMSGSNLFGQWSYCEPVKNKFSTDTENTPSRSDCSQFKLLQINWSYNILQDADNFYISGAWYGKTDEFVKVLLPKELEDAESNKINDLLIVGNDYKILLVSKSTNTIWVIDLKIENETQQINNNIEVPLGNVEKRKKTEISVAKVVLVNDSCLYLTSAGDVYSGMTHPSNVNTNHCRGTVCDIQCGYEHYLLLTDTGLVYTWGNGRRLQLGHGDICNLELPTEVEALAGIKIKKVACGGWHSFALTECGDLYAWGWNDSGQLGIKCDRDELESHPIPTLVDLFNNNGDQVLINVKDVACGSRHSALLLEDNSIWTSGFNNYGQLGCSEKQYPKICYFMKVEDCDSNCALMCGPWTTVILNEIKC